MKRAAIYARISDDRRGDQLGVRRQESDARSLCEERGWDVALVLVDDDVSAYSGRPRPGYERLCEALKAGEVDAVVAWHPDRLHRSPKELEAFIDLVQAAGATVATVKAGDYDLATYHGQMIARIVGAVARNESDQKAERIRRKHLELAERGEGKGGGTRPFGFLPDRLTIDLVEAELVREAARRVLAGETVRSVCIDWNAREIPTSTGRRWVTSVLQRILLAPRTAGLREHRGVVKAKAVWPAILDEVTHARLRATLLNPDRRVNGNPRRYLLTGLVLCGRCGAKLVARPKEDKRRAYVCATGPGFHGCGKIGSLAEPLEAHVALAVARLVDGPELARAVAERKEGPSGQLLAEVEAVEANLAQAAQDHYVDGVIGREQFLAASRALEARLGKLRGTLAAQEQRRGLEDLAGQGRALALRWEAMEFDQRRAVVAATVERVVVGPAVRGRNFFDPDRVSGQTVWGAALV